MTRLALPLAAGLLLAAPVLRGDVIVFTNGDRMSGTIVARGTKRIKLRTPYGRLDVPRTEIERLVWDDGREELINAPPEPPPPKTTSDLELLVQGHTFWHAWKPELAPADPSLRLVARVDGQVVAAYTDVNLDPDDLPGSLVNSFVFRPERLLVGPGEGVKARAPEPGGGRIRLALELPAGLAGQRWLGLAYQLNDGTSSHPEWRDVVQAGAAVDLSPETPVRVRLQQDRGLMEYRDGGMRHVETFQAVAHVVPSAP